ncbi:Ammonium transporter [Psidium guajava]|nr:Ammonium transporter [Psidium guajava]
MKKPELILIPTPGVSDDILAIESAACLLGGDPQVYVTVLAMKAPFTHHLDVYPKSNVSLESCSILGCFLPAMCPAPLINEHAY